MVIPFRKKAVSGDADRISKTRSSGRQILDLLGECELKFVMIGHGNSLPRLSGEEC